MQQFYSFILHPRTGKVFLSVLAASYLAYLLTWGSFLYMPLLFPASTISEHSVQTNLDDSLNHWTRTTMLNANDLDVLTDSSTQSAQASTDTNANKAVKQQGQAPRDTSVDYPLSTVGKVFFTTGTGRDSMCSGTAIVSRNRNTVDTAGHCLYLFGGWSSNVVFCPLYSNGKTPFGCWAARNLEVPADWINGKAYDFHHDFGMAIVAPNSEGNLTDLVGGAGWAYNQPVNQPFYAYGYPAGHPFDGQTRQTCEPSNGTLWPHGGGSVVSIPCNMTGGSSGGPWFIKEGNNWYINGHNDFISSIKYGHMFSPYYDDTWYALYAKAQNS